MDARYTAQQPSPRSHGASRRAVIAAAVFLGAGGVASSLLPEDAAAHTNRRIRRKGNSRNTNKSSESSTSTPGQPGQPGQPGTVIGGVQH